MIFLYIYLGISVLTLLCSVLISFVAAYEFRRRFPDIKVPKSSWADSCLTIIRLVGVCVIPIINLYLLYMVFVNTDQTIEDGILKLYKKYSNEGEQNYETQE